MGTDHHAPIDPTDAAQRRVLVQVMVLNAVLAAALLAAGLTADSSGLIANALDNGSDAVTYAISYFAVARSFRWKAGAAAITGVMLLVLAVGIVFDAYNRYQVGSEPMGPVMMIMALGATAVNFWCIKLLRKDSQDDVNLRAAWTMSINDFASNFGILVAGGLVFAFSSNWPDLAIGLVIAAVATYGGISTLSDAWRTYNGAASESSGQSHD